MLYFGVCQIWETCKLSIETNEYQITRGQLKPKWKPPKMAPFAYFYIDLLIG